MRKFSLVNLIAYSGCLGVLLIVVMFVAVVTVASQKLLSPFQAACAPADGPGPEQLSNAPKPSPKTTGPSAYPAAYTVRPASRPSGGETVQNVALARADAANSIPSNYVPLYKAAGTKYGIPWSVLAGVGKVESDHGRSKLPGVSSGENYAHAAGPMQFIPGTWKAYGTKDINDRYNPALAIPAAAKYLKALGAATNPRKALWQYNGAANSSWGYADLVLSWAKRYDKDLSLSPANPSQVSCGGGGFGAGGSYAPGSVCHDAAGFVAGHITKRMACVRDQIKAKFTVPRGIGCYRADGGIAGGGEHPLGRACDFMISSGSPKADEVKLGYDIANWAKANAKRLGIDYIIYRQHIWNPARAKEGWRQMEDRGGLTANHYDHVHISVLAGDTFNA
ncbi:transglycosylase SLT domain-containing protein [Actinomadura nitritigenes]|uniref:lytic transglycosylase domain-containing protein n=1 Tax=Actinomadura nitritigenes TaxID=134602 RepID=UPI003D8D3726